MLSGGCLNWGWNYSLRSGTFPGIPSKSKIRIQISKIPQTSNSKTQHFCRIWDFGQIPSKAAKAAAAPAESAASASGEAAAWEAGFFVKGENEGPNSMDSSWWCKVPIRKILTSCAVFCLEFGGYYYILGWGLRRWQSIHVSWCLKFKITQDLQHTELKCKDVWSPLVAFLIQEFGPSLWKLAHQLHRLREASQFKDSDIFKPSNTKDVHGIRSTIFRWFYISTN